MQQGGIQLGCERLQGCCQAALVASGLVLVDDLLVGDTVDRRNGRLENLRCSSLVACFDRLADGLDCRTQRGTLAGVVSVLLDCLTSTFARLCGICHECFLNRNRAAFAECDTKFSKAADYSVFLGNGQWIQPLDAFPAEIPRMHALWRRKPTSVATEPSMANGYNCAP